MKYLHTNLISLFFLLFLFSLPNHVLHAQYASVNEISNGDSNFSFPSIRNTRLETAIAPIGDLDEDEVINYAVPYLADLSSSPGDICTSLAATDVGGTVWEDWDYDGIMDESTLIGVVGVLVTITGCDGVELGTTFTDSSGDWSFGVAAAPTCGTCTDVQVVYSLPAAVSSWAKVTQAGTDNGTTVQFVQPGNCASLGVASPTGYCDTSPRMATVSYVNGDPLLGGSAAALGAVVSFPYNASGDVGVGPAVDHDATFGEVGAVWGTAYQNSTRTLFTSAILKRHAGFGTIDGTNSTTGGIYAIDYSSAIPTVTNWLDINTLAGVNTGADPHTGLPADETVRNHDPNTFEFIGKRSIGDIDISEDGNTLYVMNLNNKEIVAIDIATKTLISRTAVPNPGCTDNSNIVIRDLNFGISNSPGNFSGYEYGDGFATDNSGTQSSFFDNLHPNTTAAPYFSYSSYVFGNPLRIDVPIANGTYDITLNWATFNGVIGGERIFDINIEGSVVENNFDLNAVGAEQIVTRTYTVSVSDGNLDLNLVKESGSNPYLASMRIAASAGTANPAPNDHRPWALKVKNGKIYVGVVCSAETSGKREDLTGTVYEWDGISTFTPIANFPLSYDRERAYNFGNVVSNIHEFYPWIDDFSDIPPEAHSSEGVGFFTQYPQPIIGDIEFDDDNNMFVAIIDRFGHQMGWDNYETDTGNTDRYFGQTSGDLLRFCNDNGSYLREGTGICATQSFSNLDGATEFFDDHILFPGAGSITHEELTMGGLSFLKGSGEIFSVVTDPTDRRSAGTRVYNTSTGAELRSYEIVDDSGNAANPNSGFFGKAAALGDIEILCPPAPIEIGNYVWEDTNGDGIQDACEAGISTITVELIKGGVVIATTITDANGQYYFSDKNAIDANLNWTGTGADVTLIASTVYTIRISNAEGGSPQTNLINLSLTSTDVNSNNSDNVDNDASIVSITNAEVTVMTGNYGSVDHSFDFGFVPQCPPVRCGSITGVKN